MSEDNNNKNGEPVEEQESDDKTEPEYREISKEELKQILEDHKKWLESDGKEGEKADFTKSNLQKANLRGANLQDAIFKGSDLKGAYLKETNLQVADFFEADLQGTNLYNSNMKKINLHSINNLADAELRYAILEDATGLIGHEFAQADLTGTKLPKNIEDFKMLETIKETSQNARNIFFAMLLGCVYSWLTIGTTTDVNLLTNTASSPLPIIQTPIPIARFYIVAPLVLLCIYFYLHLYLDNLWEGLASLPAIFPDGKRLDQRAYPWLLNTLVRKHFKRLQRRPKIAQMKEWITIFLAWWMVPITMMVFWLRYIPRHDWVGTAFHISLISISFAFGIIFYRICALTLQGEGRLSLSLNRSLLDRRFYQGASVVMVGIVFSLLSYGAIEGKRIDNGEEIYYTNVNEIVPWVFEKIGYDVFANFREKDISVKPNDYYKIESVDKQVASVKGANLKGRNLNNADMHKAFLVNADMREASLFYADLRSANLQVANLRYANLEEALLEEAYLQKADLEGANLQEADFEGANLQEANLKVVNLQGANLEGAYLQEANLSDAKLQKADLMYANLKEANLGGANLQEAKFDGGYLQEADLRNANLQEAYLQFANLQKAYLYNAILQEANLTAVNLKEAYLGSANLQEANLEGAYLQEADLRNANLLAAKSLDIKQLSQVKTLYQAKLDPDLLKQVKECCPHLLEKPKNEEDKIDVSE